MKHIGKVDAGSIAVWLFRVALVLLVASAVLKSLHTGPRIGAIARDGWRSNAVGQGACSHHGGVKRWIHREIDSPFRVLIIPFAAVGAVALAGSGVAAVRLLGNERRTLPISSPNPSEVTGKPMYGTCPRCCGHLVRRIRRRDGKPFLGCGMYPRCRYTRNL